MRGRAGGASRSRLGGERARGGRRGDDRGRPRRRAAARDGRSWSTAASTSSSAGAATASIAAAPATDTIKEADAGGRVIATLDRVQPVGGADAAGVPGRGAAQARSRRGRSTRAYDDAQLVEAAGGDVRIVEAPRENIKVTTPFDLRVAELLLARRARAVMLDRLPHPPAPGRPRGNAPSGYFTEANVAALPRGGRASGASRSSASPSTSTASGRRSTSGAIRSGRRTPSTTSTHYCEFVQGMKARRPRVKLGLEVDYVPGQGGADRGADRRAAVGLRDRLGPLHRRRRGGPRRLRRLARLRARTRSGASTSGRSARRPRSGLFDILAHPDLVKVWGAERPLPSARPARASTSWRSRASPARTSRSRSRRPACASPSARSTLRGSCSTCAWRPAGRSRCPPTRTSRSSSATSTSRRCDFLREAGVERAVGLRAAGERSEEPLG